MSHFFISEPEIIPRIKLLLCFHPLKHAHTDINLRANDVAQGETNPVPNNFLFYFYMSIILLLNFLDT